jgi:hypothetical protein
MPRWNLVKRGWLLLCFVCSTAIADWPGLRGSPDHAGLVRTNLDRPLRLLWAREFTGERLGTAMEPIVAGGKLFVATHSGNLYGCDAMSGVPLWRFKAEGPFLHSPAISINALVIAASVDGALYGISARSGEAQWSVFLGQGGAAASPLVVDDRIFIGSRAGDFACLRLEDGKEQWRMTLGAAVRQTAAFSENRVYVTAEDLRVRCFDGATGKLLWVSEELSGQTARDYYPLVVRVGQRRLVIVRTNPILNMGQRIGRDRTVLARSAGASDSNWKKTEEWIASDASHGNPELWAKEQSAIIDYLQTNREAQTFFVLDAESGREAFTAPVLWIGGCQGVGAEPALTESGRLLVFYRSAYGNWNHGVAPFVTLGLYDLARNQITPLFHQQGKKPLWNCFWGTADEAQNFLVCGDTALIIHQGTLSGLDFKKNELFPIYGERDTFGGFRSPAWARNEWHGPARAGVAITDGRVYWQTGSRILCLGTRPNQEKVQIASTRVDDLAAHSAAGASRNGRGAVASQLAQRVEEILSKEWAPLFVDPGLAGRDFSFDKSSDLFEAFSWAYPHVSSALQARIRERLALEWNEHPPFEPKGFYLLKEGVSRETFRVPLEYRARLGGDKPPHPFGGTYSAWLYRVRCGETTRVDQVFEQLKQSFQSFVSSHWKLDPDRGDLYANRYLSSLLAYEKLAAAVKDPSRSEASRLAAETTQALVQWWEKATGTLTNFNGSAQLDPFINQGDSISFRIAPHRHKIALFHELSPEVAALIRAQTPESVERVWQTFDRLYPTWYVMGEERQVHFGENFVDPPDLAMDAFKALAMLRREDGAVLGSRIDLPFCRADLYHATKLALIQERF